MAARQYIYVVLMQSIRHGHDDVARVCMELMEMLNFHKSVGASLRSRTVGFSYIKNEKSFADSNFFLSFIF